MSEESLTARSSQEGASTRRRARRAGGGAPGVRIRPTGGALRFRHPEGLAHELAVSTSDDEPLSASSPEIPREHALAGLDGVRAYAAEPAASARLLRDALGFASDDDREWLVRGERREG